MAADLTDAELERICRAWRRAQKRYEITSFAEKALAWFTTKRESSQPTLWLGRCGKSQTYQRLE